MRWKMGKNPPTFFSHPRSETPHHSAKKSLLYCPLRSSSIAATSRKQQPLFKTVNLFDVGVVSRLRSFELSIGSRTYGCKSKR